MPTPVAAEPHTTGNTTPWATPVASVASSSALEGIVPFEVALHEVVVTDHDPLDQLLAHLVLGGGQVARGSARAVASRSRR